MNRRYKMNRKIIIDTDPGIDDAYAIIAALTNSKLDIMGITCVCGNKGIENVVANSLKLTQFLNKEVLVYQGAKTNLKNMRNNTVDSLSADVVHGNDGLGNVHLDYDQHNLSTLSAVDYIVETVKKYPDQIEILAIGPLTNIALAIEKDLQAMKHLKAIYSMGGGIDRGNITPFAEFNYYFDELATDIVYRSLQEDVNIYMIGLDATHSTRVTHNDLAFMRYEGGKLGKLLFDISQLYSDMYYQKNGYLGSVLHDVIAYLYMIDTTIATSIKKNVYIDVMTDRVHRGQTVINNTKKAKTTIIMNCDRVLTNQIMIKALFPNRLKKYIEVTTKL